MGEMERVEMVRTKYLEVFPIWKVHSFFLGFFFLRLFGFSVQTLHATKMRLHCLHSGRGHQEKDRENCKTVEEISNG